MTLRVPIRRGSGSSTRAGPETLQLPRERPDGWHPPRIRCSLSETSRASPDPPPFFGWIRTGEAVRCSGSATCARSGEREAWGSL